MGYFPGIFEAGVVILFQKGKLKHNDCLNGLQYSRSRESKEDGPWLAGVPRQNALIFLDLMHPALGRLLCFRLTIPLTWEAGLHDGTSSLLTRPSCL